MLKKILLAGSGIVIVAVVAFLLFFNKGTDSSDKLNVVVSFNAMKEFAMNVGGDKVNVSVIVPDGSEPHDFEPKPSDLAALSSADVFVYNGLGMEPWAEEAISAAKNDQLVSVVASEDVDKIKNVDEEEIEEHGEFDPHTWLSLTSAIVEVNAIRDAFINADDANKDFYEKNASDYTAKLQKLYDDYRTKFADKADGAFVTGHAAFAYLARDFGLTENSVEDTYAEGEPTPSQLAELVEFCKENGVTVIFAEEMASPEVSETLAREIGARVETVYTIESNEDDLSYLDRMSSNLEKIFNSL
jgi:zinc transport system substrate-binding protein